MIAATLERIRVGAVEVRNDKARMAFLRTSLIWIAIAWVVLSIAVPILGRHYRIGLDLEPIRCMPWRAYVMKFEHKTEFSRGEYVAFIGQESQMGLRFAGKTIGKEVVGVPGDRLLVRNDFAWINGQPIGALTLNAKLHKGPGAFDRDETIPAGKILVVGTTPQSYDGRYWGFLDQKYVVGTLKPLF